MDVVFQSETLVAVPQISTRASSNIYSQSKKIKYEILSQVISVSAATVSHARD